MEKAIRNPIISQTVMKTIITPILIYYIILFLSHPVTSQPIENILFDRISSENIKLEKGLSQNSIHSIIQDQEGYMWFGTWDGLNKYDGKKFTIYNREDGLSNQTILALFQSADGMIWIGTEEGLNTFNPINGMIRSYFHNSKDTSSISSNWINQIFEDHLGRIWIATSRGLNLYNKATDSFLQFLNTERDNTSIRSNWINKMAQEDESNYWFATRYGLIRYNSITKVITRYYHKPGDPGSLCSNVINTLFIDSRGNLWIGTERGLSKLDKASKMFRNYYHDPDNPKSISNNNISAIGEDSEGKLWFGSSGGGLNQYNEDSDNFTCFQYTEGNNNSLSNDMILSILCDDHGTIWVGTFKGVSKIDKNSSKFPVFRNEPDATNSLNNNFVWDFLEVSPGEIWIATEGGINILNENTNEFKHVSKKPGIENTLSSNYLRDILKDRNGNYWIGTRDSGAMKISAGSGKIEKYVRKKSDTNCIVDNFVNILFEDNDGNIWIGTNNGLSKLNPSTNRFRNFKALRGTSDPGMFSGIYDIFQDGEGVLWFASLDGMTRYHPETDSFSNIQIKSRDKNRIVSNKLFSFYEDKDGILWIGTRGGGLVRFDREQNDFKIYTMQDGLPNNVVYGALEDDNGILWISTNWGLSKFNREDEAFINYDAQDGLQGNEFNGNALLKSSSGKLFFGGMNGFNSFYPDEIKINKNIPKVEITGFTIFNEAVPYEVLQIDTIYLSHDDNFFSFEFASLDYTNPSKNKYRFMLEGVNNNWRETDADHPSAEYTKVAPGTYTFKVQGSNNDGYWNEEGHQITIVISPPWWRSWFFRVPLIIIIITVVSSIIYIRFRSIKKEHEADRKVLAIEKQMFDIEQKALQLQMNPHFIFNSLNSIQSFVLQNDTDKAINYLAKFSQLMRLILANSRESYISLKDELTALEYYMDIEKLRFDNKFDYEIKIHPGIDEEFVDIPPMLLQPYIENAIIHGLINSPKKGLIKIEFRIIDDKIRCIIEDNGIGRDKSEMIKREMGFNRKSRGLMITKERLDLLSRQEKDKFSVKISDLKDRSGDPKGTRVELVILFRES